MDHRNESAALRDNHAYLWSDGIYRTHPEPISNVSYTVFDGVVSAADVTDGTVTFKVGHQMFQSGCVITGRRYRFIPISESCADLSNITPPPGFIVADGRALSRTAYPERFAYIKNLYKRFFK